MSEMKPGPEFDRLIFKKVFGHKLTPPWSSEDGEIKVTYPAYSADIAAAWEVVDKFGEDFARLQLVDGQWECWINVRDLEGENTGTAMEKGETPAHAICKSALKAVGHEKA